MNISSRPLRPALLALAYFSAVSSFSPPSAQAVSILNISMPSGSMESPAWPATSGVYSEAPGSSAVGIGRIVDPSSGSSFSMHEHTYVAAYVPDPMESVVTYQFDTPAVVTGLELNVHANGISRIEALVGNSPGSLVSLGIFTGSLGAPMGAAVLTEHAINSFGWANTTAATYFQFVVKNTTHPDGYANYTAIPLFHEPPQGVPDSLGSPAWVATLIGLAALRRKAVSAG